MREDNNFLGFFAHHNPHFFFFFYGRHTSRHAFVGFLWFQIQLTLRHFRLC